MYKHDKWEQIHSEVINLKCKQTSLNEVDPMFHQSNQKVTIYVDCLFDCTFIEHKMFSDLSKINPKLS